MEQHIGVVVIVLNKEGNQFLAGVRKGGYMQGTLGLPGGRINFEEMLSDAAKRELIEETGMIAKEVEYVGVVRENQKNYTFIHFVFTCSKFKGEPQNMEPEKCEGWKWINFENVPDNVLRGHRGALDIYKNKKGYIDLI